MSEALEVLRWPESLVDRFQVAVAEDSESVDWDDAVARFLLACVHREPSMPTEAGQACCNHRSNRDCASVRLQGFSGNGCFPAGI